jgi:hypothetical protein
VEAITGSKLPIAAVDVLSDASREGRLACSGATPPTRSHHHADRHA